FNSAEISKESMPAVQALGDALSDAKLRGSTFVVAGHTDGVGGEQFNQELSERRADTIKHYLVDHYHLASGDLVTVGYGKTKLKNAAPPPRGRQPPCPGRQHGQQDRREVTVQRLHPPAAESGRRMFDAPASAPLAFQQSRGKLGLDRPAQHSLG